MKTRPSFGALSKAAPSPSKPGFPLPRSARSPSTVGFGGTCLVLPTAVGGSASPNGLCASSVARRLRSSRSPPAPASSMCVEERGPPRFSTGQARRAASAAPCPGRYTCRSRPRRPLRRYGRGAHRRGPRSPLCRRRRGGGPRGRRRRFVGNCRGPDRGTEECAAADRARGCSGRRPDNRPSCASRAVRRRRGFPLRVRTRPRPPTPRRRP